MTHFLLRLSSWTDVLRFSYRICWYSSELIVPSMMASRPAEKQDQTMLLPPPPPCFHRWNIDSYAGMLFLSSNITLLILKFYFGLICPQNISPIALWLVHMIFSKLQMGSNILFGEQWLCPCNSTMHTMVVQCSPDGGLMNINIRQCEKGLWLLIS